MKLSLDIFCILAKLLNNALNTPCGLAANACKNSVLDAFIPASERSATISDELPPVAAFTTESTIPEARSGAIAPTIADTDVSTPDI